MATEVRHRRGTSAQLAAATPAQSEIIHNVETNTLHVGDGSTLGGHPLAKTSDIARVSAANFDTRSSVQSTNIPGQVNYVRTAGYSTVGDGGGALYKLVTIEPSHAGKVQSADGAWWEIAGDEINLLMFGAKRNTTAADLIDAYLNNALEYCRQKNATLNILNGTYYGQVQQSATDVTVLIGLEVNVIRASTGLPFDFISRNGMYIDAKYAGTILAPDPNVTIRGDHRHIVNGKNLATTGAGPTQYSVSTWYDGTAENAYLVNQQNFYSFIQYGERKKNEGQRASGTVSLQGGHINVFSVEKKSGGSGRSEITPLAFGVNFKSDAAVDGLGSVNIYNDIVVSGPVNSDAYFREGFLAGLSLLVNKYTPGNGLDAEHSGSYGLVVATRPQVGGFAPDQHTTPSYAQRAGVVVAGFSGPQGTIDGRAPGATNGFDVAFLAGGGENLLYGGGSQWLTHQQRSKFEYGFMASDYSTAGIRLTKSNNTNAYSIWVDDTAGPVKIEQWLLLTNLPTSPTGLSFGQVWRDPAAGNVLKVV